MILNNILFCNYDYDFILSLCWFLEIVIDNLDLIILISVSIFVLPIILSSSAAWNVTKNW